MYTISWAPRAVRQIEKISDRGLRTRVFLKIDELIMFPACTGVQSLKQHKYQYRMRIGRYRILFNVCAEERVISIKEVKQRNEQTY